MMIGLFGIDGCGCVQSVSRASRRQSSALRRQSLAGGVDSASLAPLSGRSKPVGVTRGWGMSSVFGRLLGTSKTGKAASKPAGRGAAAASIAGTWPARAPMTARRRRRIMRSRLAALGDDQPDRAVATATTSPVTPAPEAVIVSPISGDRVAVVSGGHDSSPGSLASFSPPLSPLRAAPMLSRLAATAGPVTSPLFSPSRSGTRRLHSRIGLDDGAGVSQPALPPSMTLDGNDIPNACELPCTLSLAELRTALARSLGLQLDGESVARADGSVLGRLISRAGLHRAVIAVGSMPRLTRVCELACFAGESEAVMIAADAVSDLARTSLQCAPGPGVRRAEAVACVWRAARALAMTGMPHRAVEMLAQVGHLVWPATADSASATSSQCRDEEDAELGAALARTEVHLGESGAGRACQRCGAVIPLRAALQAVFALPEAGKLATAPTGVVRRKSDQASGSRPGKHSIACPLCHQHTVPRLAARLPGANGSCSETVWAELLAPHTLSSELQRVAQLDGPASLHLGCLQALNPRLFLSFAFCVAALAPRGCDTAFLTDGPSDAWVTSLAELHRLVRPSMPDATAASEAPVLLLPPYAQDILRRCLCDINRHLAPDAGVVSSAAIATTLASTPCKATGHEEALAQTSPIELVDAVELARDSVAPVTPARAPAASSRYVDEAVRQLRTELEALRGLCAAQAAHAQKLLVDHARALSAAADTRVRAYREDAMASKAALLRAAGRVRVLLRIRPLRSAQLAATPASWDSASGTVGCLEWAPDGAGLQAICANVPVAGADGSCRRETAVTDRVFSPGAGQQDVWDEVCPVVMHCLQGGAGSVLAYGQTGSGKTHTMGMAADAALATSAVSAAAGVVPRALFMLMNASAVRNGSLVLTLSCVELHNSRIVDLLSTRSGDSSVGEEATDVRVHAGGGGKRVVRLVGVEERALGSAEDGLELLATATARRATSSTLMNASSSRSHCIVVLRLYVACPADGSGAEPGPSRGHSVGKLVLADLAGSERAKRAGTDGSGDGVATLRESSSINSSLSALGNMMNALAKNSEAGSAPAGAVSGHVPWRDSLLTQLLADCVGGDAATVFVATLAPDDADAMETARTLQIADRAMRVRSSAGMAASGGAAMAERRAARLEQQLAASKSTAQRLRLQLDAARQAGVAASKSQRHARSRACSTTTTTTPVALGAASDTSGVHERHRTPGGAESVLPRSISPIHRVHDALSQARSRRLACSSDSPAARLAAAISASLASQGAEASPGTMIHALAQLAAAAVPSKDSHRLASQASAPPPVPPLSLPRAACTPIRAGTGSNCAALIMSPRSNARSAGRRRTPQSRHRTPHLYNADGHRINLPSTPQAPGLRA